jgi:hypothetical protein
MGKTNDSITIVGTIPRVWLMMQKPMEMVFMVAVLSAGCENRSSFILVV